MSLRHLGALAIELKRSRDPDNSDSKQSDLITKHSDCTLFLLRQELQGHQIKVAGGRFKANNWKQICTKYEVALGNPAPQEAVAARYVHGSTFEI